MIHNRSYRIALAASGVLFMLGASCAATAGCNVIAGLDKDYHAVIPDGWDGPFSMIESIADSVGCAPEFEEEDMLHAGLLAAVTCNCEAPPAACRPRANVVDVPVASCLALPAFQTILEPDLCTPIEMDDQYIRADQPVPEDIACLSSEPEGPEWALNVRMCRGVTGKCIRQPGDGPCPAGPFSSRQVLFRDYDDTRNCDCGRVVGTCNGLVGIFGDGLGLTPLAACEKQGGVATAQLAFGVCAGKHSASYARYVFNSVNLSCDVSAEEAFSGAAVPAGPVTVCCQP